MQTNFLLENCLKKPIHYYVTEQKHYSLQSFSQTNFKLFIHLFSPEENMNKTDSSHTTYIDLFFSVTRNYTMDRYFQQNIWLKAIGHCNR